MNKTVRIKIEYRGKEYLGNIDKLSTEDFEELEKKVETIVDGEMSHAKLKIKNLTHYFPKDVLKESIITIEEL